MKYLVGFAVIALVIVLATFGIQNPFPVSIRFLQFRSAAVPLYLIILLSAVIGILVSALLSIPGRIQRRIELRHMRQQAAEHVQQISDLKSRLPAPVMQPLSDE